MLIVFLPLFSVVFSPYFPLHCRHHRPWFSLFFLSRHKLFIHLQVIITSMVPDTFLIIPLKIFVLLVLYVKLDFFMVTTLLMKILSIICHVPSSLFSYFLFVFVLFAPILVCLSIIIIIIIIISAIRYAEGFALRSFFYTPLVTRSPLAALALALFSCGGAREGLWVQRSHEYNYTVYTGKEGEGLDRGWGLGTGLNRGELCVREYGAVEQPLLSRTVDGSGNSWTLTGHVRDPYHHRGPYPPLRGADLPKDGRRNCVSGGGDGARERVSLGGGGRGEPGRDVEYGVPPGEAGHRGAAVGEWSKRQPS